MTWFTVNNHGPLEWSSVEYPRKELDEIVVNVYADPIALVDGDRYQVTFYGDEPGTPLWKYESTAHYESSYPNGQACDTVPCRQMVVHLHP